MGPNSRALLQTLTTTDLANAAFPFGTSREIEIGYARAARHPHQLHGRARLGALCARRNSPAASSTASSANGAPHRPEALRHACHGLACASRRPIAIGATTSARRTRRSRPASASSSPIDKKAPFIGRDALLKQKSQSAACPSAWCSSPSRTRSRCSITTSRSTGAASWSAIRPRRTTATPRAAPSRWAIVNNPDGVDQAWIDGGKFEIEVACERVPARVSLRPMYDPKSERMRA